MPDEPVADGTSPAPAPTPASAPETVSATGSAPSGESVPITIPAGAEPASPAVDLHVSLGPLLDRGVLRPRAGQIWAWALAGGGLAGFAAWLAGESVLGWFSTEVRTAAQAGAAAPLDAPEARRIAAEAVKNAALAFGLLGWLMALLLGLAGGMVRASLRAGVRAALVGSGLGLATGVVVTMLVLPRYMEALSRLETADQTKLYAILALGVVWGSVGAAGGVAFGLGMGGWKRAALGLVGGFLGGLVGAAIFMLVGALGFPTGDPTLPIADNRQSRLLARALAALCTSAGVAAFIVPTRFQEQEPEKPAG